MLGICGANQLEICFIGNGKSDAPIRPLKKVALFAVVKAFGHDMTSTHQPYALG